MDALSDQKQGNRRQKISAKISKSLAIVLVPSLVVLIVIACVMSARSISFLNDQLLDVQAAYAVSVVDDFFNSKLNAVSMFHKNADFQQYFKEVSTPQEIQAYGQKKVITDILQTAYETMKDGNVEQVWLADRRTDSFFFSDGQVTDADLDNLSWYSSIMTNKKTLVTEPYVDLATGKQIISVVSPVFADNGTEVAGFFGVDVFLDSLAATLSEIKVGKNGYMELLSNESIYIYSDDDTAMGKSVTELDITDRYKNNVLNKTTGILDFSYGRIKYTANFQLSDSTGWLVIATIPMSEVNATRNQLILILVVISLMIMFALLYITVAIIRKTMQPLTEMNENVQEFARGNLNVDIQVHNNDEIGSLADNVRFAIQTQKEIIKDISGILTEISVGNLDQKIKGNYIGDFQPIGEALSNILQSLNDTLGQINMSADQVANGSNQVANASQGLSQGATEQAGAIEELAATISQISDQVTSNASNAAGANEKVAVVGKEAMESNRRMEAMLEAMEKISESSRQIENIIKTIEDIASQTNLLSLNAAIEAARAGEAGRGFAVVADEVRDLASKSADASRDTAQLIQSSLQAVDHGMKIADDMAKFLKNVVEGVKDVANTINNISVGSEQQAESLQQVTLGVDQISSVVQTNSATAEESAAASQQLSGLAQMMKTQVERFRLK